MPLRKDETRVTLTEKEITFLLERLEGYQRTPEHATVWEKLSRADNRLFRKSQQKGKE